MDIAGLSIAMNQQQVHMDAGTAVMNKSKQVAEQSGEQLVKMLEQSTPEHPTLGHSIDLSV